MCGNMYSNASGHALKLRCVENGKNFQLRYGNASGNALGRGGNALRKAVTR